MKVATTTARRTRWRRVPGFTLIEIMIVVLVISIIVGAVLFSVDVTGTQKARQAVSDLRLLMRGLANEAILEGHRYGIRWQPKQQTFRPVVEKGGRWTGYDGVKGDRPSFKTVSWKGIAQVVINVGGISFDEREKDHENFYSGKEEEYKHGRVLVQFWPTGLWSPAGNVEFIVGRRSYATLEWTAAGRLTLVQGNTQL